MGAINDASQWHDFAIGVSGASAALAGLLVVAMSINVREILRDPRLPPRAAGALCMVVTPLVIAICLLIPSQSKTALGLELLGIGSAAAAVLPALNWPRHLASARTPIQWLYGTGLP